ncbi:MAG: hypothetical protein A3K00_09805 [Gallionellales bacterium RIFOXYD2_FULL_52_7]|nr:MAG: hypothetical protein A3K00_09805 [Gallionellales bacterium RIFOXYD2_FULL_52_7]
MKNKHLTNDSIRKLLDHATVHLDTTTASHLRSARNRALAYQAPRPAWLDRHGILVLATRSRHGIPFWALSILLAAGLLLGTATYWQHATEHDHSDIDIAILTDDLPVDAYID